MASFGRGAPRHYLTSEQEDILADLRSLTSINDYQMDSSVLEASVLIPEGGRRRPLKKISNYRIPTINGLEPNLSDQVSQKRVGKGRSRIPDRIKDRPLNLGLEEQFAMYNQMPCSDHNMKFINHLPRDLEKGYRLPYSLPLKGMCGDVNLSATPKLKTPGVSSDFSLLNIASNSDPEHGGCSSGQFPQTMIDFSIANNGDGNFDSNVPNQSKFRIPKIHPYELVNWIGDSGKLVPSQITYHDDQFTDFEEVVSSQSRPSSTDKTPSPVCPSTHGEKCQIDAPENTCLSSETHQIQKNSSGLNGDGSSSGVSPLSNTDSEENYDEKLSLWLKSKFPVFPHKEDHDDQFYDLEDAFSAQVRSSSTGNTRVSDSPNDKDAPKSIYLSEAVKIQENSSSSRDGGSWSPFTYRPNQPCAESSSGRSGIDANFGGLDQKDSSGGKQPSKQVAQAPLPKSKSNLQLDGFQNSGTSVMHPSVQDWWDYPSMQLPPGSQLVNYPQFDCQADAKLEISPAKSPHLENCVSICSSDSQSNSQQKTFENASNLNSAQEKQYVLFSEPKRKSSSRKKSKLVSYSHARDTNNVPPIGSQHAQRQPALGWGDTSFRNASCNTALFEVKRNPQPPGTPLRPGVSSYGNAEDFNLSCGLNAFMKPIASQPVFSMEDDFPTLPPPSHKSQGKEASPNGAAASLTSCQETKTLTSSLANVEVIPEKPKDSSFFDQHTIVIENLPPDCEDCLREFLEEFVTVVSITIFSTDAGQLAYVRLESEEKCEWLIDCYDGCSPGVEWTNNPLKIRKLK